MHHFRLLLAILVLHQISVSTPADAPPATCKCGVPNRSARIQGGNPTEKNEYPWQAALVPIRGSNPFCGATVISNQHVLTAARCCFMRKDQIRVLLREHRTDDKSDGQIEVQVSTMTRHPLYSSNPTKYDLCVLQLATTLNFNTLSNRLAPACLPTDPKELYVGQQGVVSGWGRTGAGSWGWGGKPSPVLRETNVDIVDNSACPMAATQTDNSVLCTARSMKPLYPGPCMGDQGGPLTVLDNLSRYELVGVVSANGGWRRSVGSPRAGLCTMHSRVYARVTAALSWIKQATAGSTTCP